MNVFIEQMLENQITIMRTMFVVTEAWNLRTADDLLQRVNESKALLKIKEVATAGGRGKG